MLRAVMVVVHAVTVVLHAVNVWFAWVYICE
jgi:hypothetical protein